ncbi:MAG: phosphodiester glycosidase family protein [Bacteroidales bacterium]|nr:phosphodiester glycosidase family protein [Bacteroidales bacterium]
MKLNVLIALLTASAAALTFTGCTGDEPYKGEKPLHHGNGGNNIDDPDVPGLEIKKVPTLVNRSGFQIDTISPGLIHYVYEGREPVTQANQYINVLELDLTSKDYKFELAYYAPGDNNPTAAEALKETRGIAAVNAGLEPASINIRRNGVNLWWTKVDPADEIYGWRHNAAIMWNDKSDVRIVNARKDFFQCNDCYIECTERNLISSGPMIIDDYKLVGSQIVNPIYTPEDLDKMDGGTLDSFSGKRHPRTIVALTEDRDLLLFTFDGRAKEADGINMAEAARFIAGNFNAQYALNMDGGGSTTMCIKGLGDPATNCVNHPTDNGKFDHDGLRQLTTFFIISAN